MPATKKKATHRRHGSAVARELIEGMESLLHDLEAGKLNSRNVYLKIPATVFTPGDVRAARESLGLSQSLFADFIGASASTVRAWERGAKTPAPIARRFLEAIKSDPGYWSAKLAGHVSAKG
jgi:putative transcriptional regulator